MATGATCKVYAELGSNAEFSVPEDVWLSDDEEALHRWVWANCKDEISRSITFKKAVVIDETKDDATFPEQRLVPSNEVCQAPPIQQQQSQTMVPLNHLVRLSREIRSPMICIVGLAWILKDTTELSNFQLESVELMLNNSQQLVALVDGVLQYEKLETAPVDIDIALINLQETLNSVVSLSKAKADECNIRIESLYDASVPEFVSTDGSLLQQILSHLLGNAIKFTDDGSVVKLSAYAGTLLEIYEACCHETHDDHVQASEDELWGQTASKAREHRTDPVAQFSDDESSQFLRFVVKDHGKGIEESEFKNIFEPFQQATTVEKDDFEGMGLGLAITSRLVKCLGGNITVKSKVGEGTEFSIDIPLNGAPADVKGFKSKLKNATILILDDDSRDDIPLTALARSGVDLVKVDSCEELAMLVESKTTIDSRRFYMCLIQEDLYQQRGYQSLANVARTALLTFGPNRTVSETMCHFPSLARTLPSVILEAMVACMEATPARPSPVKRRPSARMNLNFDFSTVKSLIAEDNLINQKVLQRMLRRLGMRQIDVVDNGRKAVECMSQKHYDVVFLDNQMPEMDGLEACRHIKKQLSRLSPGPEIVFMTANASVDFLLEASHAGGNGIISKPFDIRAIESYFRTQTKLYRPKTPMATPFV